MAEKEKLLKRTVYVPSPMAKQIQQILDGKPRSYTFNDFAREAFHAYLDEQVDIVTSRRHFQKSLNERVDKLQSELSDLNLQIAFKLLFYLNILLHMLAICFATILSAITKENVTAKALIQQAVIEARRQQNSVDMEVEAVRQMKAPES